MRSLGRHRLAIFGVLVLILVVLAAVLAPVLATHDPTNINLLVRLKPPGHVSATGERYLLGTDSLGRDVLARMLYGARISLSVGLGRGADRRHHCGALLGLVAGYFGGVLDDVIMRWADIQLAFPLILLAVAILAVLGPGIDKLVIVLGISQWMQYARLTRAQTIQLREFRVHRGGARRRRQPCPDDLPAHRPQSHGPGDRHRLLLGGEHDHHRGFVELPGPGRAARHSHLGWHRD